MSASTNIVYQQLPNTVLPEGGDQMKFISDFLKNEIPKKDHEQFDNAIRFNFLLNSKLAASSKVQRPLRKKKTFLTRNERKNLALVKLPKDNWNYEELLPLHQMWCDYMKENLDLIKTPECPELDYNQFAMILTRSEFIGAQISVVRSKVPSQVGLSGIIVLETKMTFQIVTPESQLKIIPKMTSVFQVLLDHLKFTIFGKHLIMKPGERSVKKIKSQMYPDL